MADSVELFERLVPAGRDEVGALEPWLVMERIARGDQRRDHADCNESSSAGELPRDSAEAVDSSSSGSSTKASSSSAEDIYGCLRVTSFFQSRSLSWRCTWYRASSTSSRSGAVVGTSSCAGGGSPASTSQGALTNCAYVVVCSLAIRDAREFFWRRHSATHSGVATRSGKRSCDKVRDSFAPTDVWARRALVWRLKQWVWACFL